MSSAELGTRAKRAQSRQVDAESPWLGLKSFDENCQGFFFGRSQEIDDLKERVLGHRLTVLYGHSGLGKTSLLKAGVVPALREEGWYPIFIRLSFDDSDPTLHTQIIKELFGQLAYAGIVTGANHQHLQELDLWELLHDPALKFIDVASNSKIKIALIFDQFEEVWTVGREKRPEDAEAVMMLLSALAENRAPLAQQIRLNADDDYAERMVSTTDSFRVLFSLREDYLHWLERWRPRMPSMMDCRVELRPLTTAKALQAAVEPGKLRVPNSQFGPILDEPTALAIVRTAAGIPPLLSLICERLNARRIQSGEDYITLDKVETRTDDVLREFYLESFDLVPAEVRHFVEDRLVSESGVRESMNIETAERELAARNVVLPANCLEELVNARILSVDYRGGVSRVELTHDLLTTFAVHYRNVRREEQRLSLQQARQAAAQYARLKLATIAIVFAGLLVSTMLGAFAWYQRDQISQLYEKVSAEEQQKTELLVREAKAYSTVGNRNWDEWITAPQTYARPSDHGKTKWHEAIANWSHSLQLNPNQDSLREKIFRVAAGTTTTGAPDFTLQARAQDMWPSPSGRLIALLVKNKLVLSSLRPSEKTLLSVDVSPGTLDIDFDADEQNMLVRNSDDHIDIYSLSSFKISQTIRTAEIHADTTITSALFVPKKKMVALSFSDQQSCTLELGAAPADAYFFPSVHPQKRQHFSEDGEQVAVFHPHSTVHRLSLFKTQKPEGDKQDGRVPLLNVNSTKDAITDLLFDSKQNRLIFVSRSNYFSVPYEETPMSIAPDIPSTFFEYDLTDIATQDSKLRMRSLSKLGTLPIDYEQLQLSGDGRWLIGRVNSYTPPSSEGCGPSTIPESTDSQPPSAFQYGAHYLLMADLRQSITPGALHDLKLTYESCCFSNDSRLVYIRDSNGCLKTFDLLALQWTQGGAGLSKLEQIKPMGKSQVVGRGSEDELVITTPPVYSPLLATFEVPGSVIQLQRWRDKAATGVAAQSEDKFDVCFTSLSGPSFPVDRVKEADIAFQRVSPYDVSGRVALTIWTLSEWKTVVWYPNKEPVEVVLGPDGGVLLSEADQALSTQFSDRFRADPMSRQAGAISHTSSPNGRWLVNAVVQFSQNEPYVAKFKRYYSGPDGSQQTKIGWENATRVVDIGGAFTLQYDTELVPLHKEWSECAVDTVEFLPDNSSLAIARTDGLVTIWDLPSLTQRGRYAHENSIQKVQFSHDGKSMLVVSAMGGSSGTETASKSNRLTLWNVAKQEPRFPAIDLVQRAVLSSSGKLVLAIDDRTQTPFLVDCATGQRENIPIHVNEVVDLTIDLEDQFAFIAVRDRVYRWQILSPEHSKQFSQLAGQDVQQVADSLSSLGVDEATGELKIVAHPAKSTRDGYPTVMRKVSDILGENSSQRR